MHESQVVVHQGPEVLLEKAANAKATRRPKNLSKVVETCTAQAWDEHDSPANTNHDGTPINSTAEARLPNPAIYELLEVVHIHEPRLPAHTARLELATTKAAGLLALAAQGVVICLPAAAFMPKLHLQISKTPLSDTSHYGQPPPNLVSDDFFTYVVDCHILLL
eukprot:jgi/Tetstr1/454834/TSEL_041714.t1